MCVCVVLICNDTILLHFPLGHCLTPKKEGPCRGSFPRWHYNAASSKCEQFFFGGCKENSNNYLSEQECLNACKNTKGNANLIVLWQCCNIGLKEHYWNKGNKSLFMCVVPNQYAAFFPSMEHLKRILKNLHLVIYYTMTVNRPVNCHTIRKASLNSPYYFSTLLKI